MLNAGTAVGYLTLDRSGYSNGLKSAYQELKTFMDSSASANDRINALGNSFESTGKLASKAFTVPILTAGTAIATVSANFEAGMSKVEAISGATGKDLELLTNKAKEMGANTKFSATEAASAFEYMAMAGWQTQDMLDGIAGVMDLAAASGEDLAMVSDIVTDALTAFGLSAKDSAHFADVLAKASNSSNTNVSMLGESFKYVAPVCGALGYSIEDTAIALGLMANSGIKAGQAGTALRAAMARLAKPTDDMQELMNRYDISLTNTDGSMKSLSAVMQNLRGSLNGMDEASKANIVTTLFGQEAMSGMLAIINASDADYRKLTESIANCDGTTKSMAETMQNNLKGSLTKIKSALEGAAISLGETLVPMLSTLADKIQGAVDWFNSLDDATKENIVKFGLYIAAVGPAMIVTGKFIKTGAGLVGIFTKLAGGIGGTALKMKALGTAGTIASNGGLASAGTKLLALSPAGIAAGAAIAGVGLALYTAHEYSDLYADSVLKATDDMSLMEKGLGHLTGATMYSKEEMEKLGYVYEEWNEKVSKDTSETLDMVAEKSRGIQFAIDSVNFDNVITDEDIATVKSKTNDWCNSIVKAIDENKSEINTSIQNLFGADGVITESEQEVLNILNANADEKIKIVNDSNEKIVEITKRAHEENRKITESEMEQISELTKKGNQALLDSMNISFDERVAAMNLFYKKCNAETAKSLSDTLIAEKAAVEESKQAIREKYDYGIEALEAKIPLLDGKQRELAEIELKASREQRNKLLQNENDKWMDIIGMCDEKYADYMEVINKYTGEELSKGELKRQEVFTKTLEQYDNLNKITEDGMYRIYNKVTTGYDNLYVKVDETSGDIVGVAKFVKDQYGIHYETVEGYSDAFIKQIEKEAKETSKSKSDMLNAAKALEQVTIDSNGNVIDSNGKVLKSLKILKDGILDLNGTPIRVEVDKDGAITNLDEIIRKMSQITDKTVSITMVEQKKIANTTSSDGRFGGYATGTLSALPGYKLVGENGPEVIKMAGGERVYNTVEGRKLLNEMYGKNGDMSNRSNGTDNSILNAVVDKLNAVATKLDKALNTESTLYMESHCDIDGESIGSVMTPVVSNKLATSSMRKRRG